MVLFKQVFKVHFPNLASTPRLLGIVIRIVSFFTPQIPFTLTVHNHSLPPVAECTSTWAPLRSAMGYTAKTCGAHLILFLRVTVLKCLFNSWE